ncbi:hypothetical protein EVAR_20489_1 [Eumeta japonica]|uniref:Uncharacterized protein n=1 Tax=Eumeta variegata TaxID=151549 RepID=A0A4C1Y9T6_EUMVA|nr:hypothetical protein EVAR_20489_1 [Eumeta japonica]
MRVYLCDENKGGSNLRVMQNRNRKQDGEQNQDLKSEGIEIENVNKMKTKCGTKNGIKSVTGIEIKNNTENKLESEIEIGIESERYWHQQKDWDENRKRDDDRKK